MKKLTALLALCLALSFTACTKREAAPEGGADEYMEGTTSAPSEEGAPTDEMQEKEGTAPADDGHAH